MSSGRAVRLSVNVDHVATLRQARRAPYPDPVEAARIAEAAGASGITLHLRGDRRHIQDSDLARLRQTVHGKLNLEMAASAEMVAIALDHRPDQVTLVPERPEEVTTEGGLDLLGRRPEIGEAADRLAAAGIAVSLFLDPDPRQLEAAGHLAAGTVVGFEINTDAYTRAGAGAAARPGGGDAEGAAGTRHREAGGSAAPPARPTAELEAVRAVARTGAAGGLAVYAGHGLTAANVGPIAAVPEIEELNIGHWLVSRAVALGLGGAVEEMLAAIDAGRRGGRSQPPTVDLRPRRDGEP